VKELNRLARMKGMCMDSHKLRVNSRQVGLSGLSGLTHDSSPLTSGGSWPAPPSHYLKHWRVEEACAYISTTGASNKEAAYRFGFWDEAHLCHLFRQVLNRTPQSFAPRRHSRPPAEASGIYKELSGFCNPVDLGGTSDVIKGKL
jgi:AraC-like DNA-binding protein